MDYFSIFSQLALKHRWIAIQLLRSWLLYFGLLGFSLAVFTAIASYYLAINGVVLRGFLAAGLTFFIVLIAGAVCATRLSISKTMASVIQELTLGTRTLNILFELLGTTLNKNIGHEVAITHVYTLQVWYNKLKAASQLIKHNQTYTSKIPFITNLVRDQLQQHLITATLYMVYKQVEQTKPNQALNFNEVQAKLGAQIDDSVSNWIWENSRDFTLYLLGALILLLLIGAYLLRTWHIGDWV